MRKPRSVKAGTYGAKSAKRAKADRADEPRAKHVAVSPVHRRRPGNQSRLRQPRTNTAIKPRGEALVSGTRSTPSVLDMAVTHKRTPADMAYHSFR